MTHAPEWHAAKAEELTDRADLLATELDFSQPAAAARLADLRHAADTHLQLAGLLPVAAPLDLCGRLNGVGVSGCRDIDCNSRVSINSDSGRPIGCYPR